MTLSAHLSNFVILLQCVLDVWLLDTRITEKTGGASGLGRGEGRGGRSRKNSKSGSRNRDKKERVTRERRREGRKGERWEGGGRGREGGREGERERERGRRGWEGGGGRPAHCSSSSSLPFCSVLGDVIRCRGNRSYLLIHWSSYTHLTTQFLVKVQKGQWFNVCMHRRECSADTACYMPMMANSAKMALRTFV